MAPKGQSAKATITVRVNSFSPHLRMFRCFAISAESPDFDGAAAAGGANCCAGADEPPGAGPPALWLWNASVQTAATALVVLEA